MRAQLAVPMLVTMLAAASPAAAQRYTFERSFPVAADSALAVVTDRGRVAIEATSAKTVEVVGTVTVRMAWDTPPNAVALAQQIATHPPVQSDGSVIQLADPRDAQERRAVTVSYVVRLPSTVPVTVQSNSGAIRVRGVRAPLSVTTRSSSIDVLSAGRATLATGSGAVRVIGTEGDLSVETQSSAIDVDGIGGAFRARTGSGAVRAALIGEGGVDVETSSSAIDVRGARGPLAIHSNSGRVTLVGDPTAAWSVTTGSSSIQLTVPSSAALALHATSRSGGVETTGLADASTRERREVVGAIGASGPAVRLDSRSGSIRVTVASKS